MKQKWQSCLPSHQVFINDHGELREGRVADLMLPMNLKAPEDTSVEPRDCLRKKITCCDLKKHSRNERRNACEDSLTPLTLAQSPGALLLSQEIILNQSESSLIDIRFQHLLLTQRLSVKS